MRALILAAGLLAWAGCTMPDLPDGYQLMCDVDDDMCPDGTSCKDGCCVPGDELPECREYAAASAQDDSPIGGACSGGCVDGSCRGTCPGRGMGNCFSSETAGFPGGLCSVGCGSEPTGGGGCNGACRTNPGAGAGGPSMICLQWCQHTACRRGWRCECNATTASDCACVPDCRLAPDVCGVGPTVAGSRCNPGSGLCWTAACGGDEQVCGDPSECCAGLTCCPGTPSGACRVSCP